MKNKIENVKFVKHENLHGAFEVQNNLIADINGEDVKIYASPELNDDTMVVSYKILRSIMTGTIMGDPRGDE